MARQENIQLLFRAITHEGVDAYLLAHDWKPQSPDTVGTRKYFGPNNDEGNPIPLWIWELPQHARYASRLQNAVFSLSVIENRSALEIANDIYEATLEAKKRAQSIPVSSPVEKAVETTSGPVLIRVHNSESRPLRIRLPLESREVVLAPESTVLVALKPGSANAYAMDMGQASLTMSGARAGDLRMYEATDKPLIQWTADYLRERVQKELLASHACHSSDISSFIESLRVTLERAAFGLATVPSNTTSLLNDQLRELVLRHASILLVGLGQKLTESPQSHQALWRIAVALLEIAHLCLPLDPALWQKLFHTCRMDDEAAPLMTFSLLKEISQLP